jgi:hypothetical protein
MSEKTPTEVLYLRNTYRVNLVWFNYSIKWVRRSSNDSLGKIHDCRSLPDTHLVVRAQKYFVSFVNRNELALSSNTLSSQYGSLLSIREDARLDCAKTAVANF